ncbi:cation:proton antiporter [Streptomyces sp. NPDC087212]|uniref:cation:proton antiporter n=1 Tax=Streptomyces sp. NPDC087212 TaxID=3365766 RepID=UPI0037FD62DD
MSSPPTFTPLPQVPVHHLLVFLLQVSSLLALALLLGALATRLRLPAVVGELAAGVLLGPSVFGHLSARGWQWLFPHAEQQVHMLDALAQVGVLLLVGLTGTQLDTGLIRRRGATAVRVSLAGLLVPLGAGIGLGYLLPGQILTGAGRATFAVFLGVAMCVSALPVIAKTLSDMKLDHRDVGQLILVAAMFDDAVGWFLLSVVSAMAAGRVHAGEVAVTAALLVAFVLAALLIGRPLVRSAFRLAGRGEDDGPTVATAVVVVLCGAAVSQLLGLEPIFGAFVAGVLIGSPGRGATAPTRRLAALRTFVRWVAAPLFLATAGLRMDLATLARPTIALTTLAVLVVAMAGKLVGAFLGGRLSGLSARESWAVGAGLNARGVVEVTIGLVGLRLGVLTSATYTTIVVVALLTSVVAAPALRVLMSGVEVTAEERLRRTALDSWSPRHESDPTPRRQTPNGRLLQGCWHRTTGQRTGHAPDSTRTAGSERD